MAKPKKAAAAAAAATPPPEFTWDIQHQGAREVFCAALTGILANPNTVVTHPATAVENANKVVEAMQARARIKI